MAYTLYPLGGAVCSARSVQAMNAITVEDRRRQDAQLPCTSTVGGLDDAPSNRKARR